MSEGPRWIDARLPRWLAGAALPVLLLLVSAFESGWSATAQEPLRITVRAPVTCAIDADLGQDSTSVEIGWEVQGGVGPYQIFVGGEHRGKQRGTALIRCGLWFNGQVNSGQMPTIAQVTDARGSVASALVYTTAVRVIRADPRPYRGVVSLWPGRTYRVHGVQMTIPDDFGLGLESYVSHNCDPLDDVCGDEIMLRWSGNGFVSRIWIRRWHLDESRRSVDQRDDVDQVNAGFDRLIASIGQPLRLPVPSRITTDADRSDLRIELNAPAICETYWGSYWGRQSIGLDWRVEGGRGPYRVVFSRLSTDLRHNAEGSQGSHMVPCGEPREDGGGVDSQVMNTQAVVVDADGRMASAVVSTYAIASLQHGGNRLRGGRTHLVQGKLLTIPEGLEFDASRIHKEEIDCPTRTCRDTGCLDGSLPVCQNLWTVSTIGRSVSVSFGELTGQIDSVRIRGHALQSDPGVTVNGEDEVRELLFELEASLDQPPRLPDWGVFRPAPLTLIGWADPPVCTPQHGSQARSAPVYRRLSGGYWWPLISGSLDWNAENQRRWVQCPREWGAFSTTLRARESGPDPTKVDTTVIHLVAPNVGSGTLRVSAAGSRTSYCPPGGRREVYVSVSNGVAPYSIQVNGVDVEAESTSEADLQVGSFNLVCGDRLGLQVATVNVSDSAEPTNHAIVPLLFIVAVQHPSGLSWSHFE